jgi:hypothetical protein
MCSQSSTNGLRLTNARALPRSRCCSPGRSVTASRVRNGVTRNNLEAAGLDGAAGRAPKRRSDDAARPQDADRHGLYVVLDRLGADEELLAVVGSWRVRLSDDDVLLMLRPDCRATAGPGCRCPADRSADSPASGRTQFGLLADGRGVRLQMDTDLFSIPLHRASSLGVAFQADAVPPPGSQPVSPES